MLNTISQLTGSIRRLGRSTQFSKEFIRHASITTTERYDNQTAEALLASAKHLDTGESFQIVSSSTPEPTITAKEPTDDADGNLLTDCELAGDAIGGEGQNRTVDTVIFSHVLYQLSYLAPEEFRAQKRRRS
jgi:hypothetical protein